MFPIIESLSTTFFTRPVIGAALVSLALLSAPSTSFGDTDGADEVLLKNGGMEQGTVVSFEHGKSVVIIVYVSDEKRTISWEEVDKVERGKHHDSASDEPPEHTKPEPRPG
jgi:hypothetical protein